jgi:solute carrier family 50 protein (sugar transporter)
MSLHLVYKNPKKNGAVSEVVQVPADAEKGQVQLQQQQQEAGHVVVVGDGENVHGEDDHDDTQQRVAVVDITLPPAEEHPVMPPPEEHPVMPPLEQPAPLPPMRMAVEVV